MVKGFLVLLAFQLAGEAVRQAFNAPVPGPVIGMLLLAAALAFHDRRRKAGGADARAGLERTADGLIGHMGLLFVPAGVGVIAEAGLLQKEWLPIAAAVLGSTVSSLAVTGLVMHWVVRAGESRSRGAVPVVAGQEVEP
jgi:putative effector of murein hydrolase LrgA (UPF0299 family)